MNKFFKIGTFIALAISIITCISICDDASAKAGDISLGFLILILGTFIYAQHLYFNETFEKKSE